METKIIINAGSKRVWEVLTDTYCWPKWGPSVTAVRCRDRYIQSGSKGYVQTVIGIWVPFEITEFIPEKNWTWKVMGTPATGHRVESLATTKCRLVFEVPWGAAPYVLICKIAARRIKLISENRF